MVFIATLNNVTVYIYVCFCFVITENEKLPNIHIYSGRFKRTRKKNVEIRKKSIGS